MHLEMEMFRIIVMIHWLLTANRVNFNVYWISQSFMIIIYSFCWMDSLLRLIYAIVGPLSHRKPCRSTHDDRSIFWCAGEVNWKFNSKRKYEKNSQVVSKFRYRTQKMIFSSKLLSPSSAFGPQNETITNPLCSFSKLCTVLNIIYLCAVLLHC